MTKKKRIMISALLTLLCMTQAVAQEYEDYEYVPFVREGVKWVYFYENYDSPLYGYDHDLALGKNYLTLEIKGDTVIDGKSYKAMHKYYGSSINQENDTIPIYLREAEKIVYGIVPDGKKYQDCPIGNRYEYIFDLIENGEEFILYDFQDPVGYWDYQINSNGPGDYEPLSVDTLVIGNHMAKRYVGARGTLGIFYMIEGVGVDSPGSGYTLFPFRPMSTGGNTLFNFSHVIECGEIVYKGFHFDPDNHVGIDEVVADKSNRKVDDNYYNLMGQPVGKQMPSTPGIYIHNGKKICVGRKQ